VRGGLVWTYTVAAVAALMVNGLALWAVGSTGRSGSGSHANGAAPRR
jgi:hypothetical protein